ncbi:Chromosome-partitioning protein Spo0J [subsurface metagenome]
MPEVKDLPVNKISAGDNALRLEADDAELDSLSASIRRVGIIVPLVVVGEGDGYTLVAGHRRLRAAIKCGLQTVPTLVREAAAAEVKEVSLAENLFRKDLTAVETAAGIKDTLDEGIMDVPGVAAALHRTEHWVHEQLVLLTWPQDVLEGIHLGWLAVSAARNLALIEDPIYREFLIRNAHDNGATARTTAAWLQAWRSMASPEEALTAEPVPGRGVNQPALPQAPCLCCGSVNRTDAMSMVMICSACINTIRNIGQTG